RMGLDQTLGNINTTLEQVHELLEVVQLATIIVAVALTVLLVGTTLTCYYGKYKKYSNISRDCERGLRNESRLRLLSPPGLLKQYHKGKYQPDDITHISREHRARIVNNGNG
ncbi:hypothetical protein PMAYCL1PPCAC_16596, partial [Pristionchus mayeri]